MDLYLVRHGQSTGNVEHCILGWSDPALTALGTRQARAAAARLAPLGPMPIICSDLQRAQATAACIAAAWGGAVEPDLRWRELHCGTLEGQSWEAFARVPELSAQFEADPFHTAMPGGESGAMLSARVSDAFAALRAREAARLLVVTHDGPIRTLLAQCLCLPIERFWTLTTDHGGLTQLEITDDWIRIRTVNDTSHLQGLAEAAP
jgi:broad specificity phosphatase PhoE